MNKYKKGLVSVGIPVWLPLNKPKKKQYIKWTLESLAKTIDKPFEIILFNNETRKESEEFLESFREQFLKNKYCKDFKIITHTKNMGWSGGWECCIENSVGEYFVIANDDLVFEEMWLSKMLKHMKPGIGAIGPTSNYTAGIQSVSENKPGVYEERVNWLIGFCMLFKRKALDLIKKQKGEMYYIDPIFYPGGSEELDVCIRLRKAGYEMLIARDVFIHHFGSRSLNYNMEFRKSPDDFFRKRQDFLFKKHGDEWKEVLKVQRCPKFAICIPTVGNIDHLVFSSYHYLLSDTLKYFGNDSVIQIIAPRNLTHVGRSELVRRAINFGAEYIYFQDDDQIVGSDTIIRLYKHNKDYVTALAYMRVPPYMPTIYKGKTRDNKWLECMAHKEGLVEIDASGLPATLISIKAFKELTSKKNKQIKKRGGIFYFSRFGEDMNLSQDLTDIGIKLYCDTDLVVQHLGDKLRVNEITFMSYHQQQKAIKDQKLKNMGNTEDVK